MMILRILHTTVIEDAKQKAEHDRKLKAAKAKKQKVSTANNNIIVYSIILATV